MFFVVVGWGVVFGLGVVVWVVRLCVGGVVVGVLWLGGGECVFVGVLVVEGVWVGVFGVLVVVVGWVVFLVFVVFGFGGLLGVWFWGVLWGVGLVVGGFCGVLGLCVWGGFVVCGFGCFCGVVWGCFFFFSKIFRRAPPPGGGGLFLGPVVAQTVEQAKHM
ncbi:hypothetical protein RA267_27525, partial [Pseudomonas syringae pv. tagetis]|uniref:hypothetical protein n=1 Tax=Pseudomonas syringae group genomosp. 7 TaxID=251699 RepID=UPI00376F526D